MLARLGDVSIKLTVVVDRNWPSGPYVSVIIGTTPVSEYMILNMPRSVGPYPFAEVIFRFPDWSVAVLPRGSYRRLGGVGNRLPLR